MSAALIRGTAAAAILCLASACGASAAGASAAGPAAGPASASSTTSTSTSAAKAAGASPAGSPSPVVVEGNPIQNHGSRTVTGQRDTAMQVGDFYFSPSILIGSPGQRLTVHLHNIGQASHTFTISSEHVNVVLSAGQRANVTVTFPQHGSLPFICQYHIGAGMAGLLEVG